MKLRKILALGAVAAAVVSCNEKDNGLELIVEPHTFVQASANEKGVNYQVQFSDLLTAPAIVTVESLDEARASVAFADGSKSRAYQTGDQEPQNVIVTCHDDLGTEADTVLIVFQVTETLESVSEKTVVREIICPGTSGGDNPGGDNPGDDDPEPGKASVIVTPTSGLVTTEDGGTAEFTVVLTQKPTSDVVIRAVSFDTTEGMVLPESATFTPSNWNEPQTFTITGQDDDILDGDVLYSILLGPALSADPAYNQLGVPSVSVTNLDNDRYTDPAGISITPQDITVYEGGATPVKVVLETEPSAPVTLSFKLSDDSRATIEPSTLTFTKSNYASTQTLNISAKRNGIPDDDVDLNVQMQISSTDSRFNDLKVGALPLHILDTEGGSGETVTFRAMAANISTGNKQSYDPGHGIRIFKAVQPDIVLIQEFRYGNNTDAAAKDMVESTFGPEYFFSRGRYNGSSWLPNGVISRYPIIDSGYWQSNVVNNRDWDWALLDIPGKKELLVVSLHLHTADNNKEIAPLTSAIEKKIAADKANGLEYHVMVGGDFNSSTVLNGKNDLKRVVKSGLSDSARPKDQNGDTSTNGTRAKTLDVLLVDDDLHYKEIPVEIGKHSYANGHVFDSRVYSKFGELGDVPPVQKDDSDSSNKVMCQHMAVIRDFSFVAE